MSEGQAGTGAGETGAPGQNTTSGLTTQKVFPCTPQNPEQFGLVNEIYKLENEQAQIRQRIQDGVGSYAVQLENEETLRKLGEMTKLVGVLNGEKAAMEAEVKRLEEAIKSRAAELEALVKRMETERAALQEQINSVTRQLQAEIRERRCHESRLNNARQRLESQKAIDTNLKNVNFKLQMDLVAFKGEFIFTVYDVDWAQGPTRQQQPGLAPEPVDEDSLAPNELSGNCVVRYSTVPPSGNAEGSEDKTPPQAPKGNPGMWALGSLAAFGGLGYAGYKYFSGEKVSCAEKGDDNCNKCEESDCLHKMDKEEEKIVKANQDLEKALKEIKPKAMEATEAALKAYCEGADTIKLFMDKAYCAIEEENLDSTRFEEVWCEVNDLAVKRCEKIKEAIKKGQCAWEFLCKLRLTVENGKACKYTSCNPLLITAEEFLLCAEHEILNGKAKMDCIQSESRIVEQYRNLVEDFRRDLKAEMESMLTSKSECKVNLTDNECTMLLTHGYKKILRVQKELSIVQTQNSEEPSTGPCPA